MSTAGGAGRGRLSSRQPPEPPHHFHDGGLRTGQILQRSQFSHYEGHREVFMPHHAWGRKDISAETTVFLSRREDH